MSKQKDRYITQDSGKSPVPVEKSARSGQRMIHPMADQIQFWQQNLGNQTTRKLLASEYPCLSHHKNPDGHGGALKISRGGSLISGLQMQSTDEETLEPLDSEAAQSRKVDASAAAVNWEDPEKTEDQATGSLTGGGRYDPHKRSDGSYKFPDVQINYDSAQKVWRITSITVYSRIVVHLPDNGAYPVVGTNVLNQQSLGVRSPKGQPEGKGYWADVAKNLLLYKHGVDFNKLQWWVQDSTEYHERKHHELYREWFSNHWKVMRTLLEVRLQTKLQKQEIQPVSKSKLEKAARFILQGIIEETERNLPDTEPPVYQATREKYWEPKAREIENQAKEKGWAGNPEEKN
jgi:hypothetical protein